MRLMKKTALNRCAGALLLLPCVQLIADKSRVDRRAAR